jgi:dolichol-phosphate mannosyltransferase
MTTSLDLSVVVPVFNEAESLPVLWNELVAVLATLGLRAEVLFVDDGSTDGSAEVVRGFIAVDSRARLVRLARNAGLSAAFAAGFRHARGRIVATLDADLQNDPADLPALIGKLDTWDAACGWRQVRHDPWLKRASSRIANGIRRRVLDDDVQDSACSLRVMQRRCVDDLEPFHGFHRFVPTLLRQAGYRVVEVPVRHRPRRFGQSHYGMRNRAWRAFVDMLGVRWMGSRRLRYEICEADKT